MAYRLQTAESVGDAVRRIAQEQVDKAIAELTDADLGPQEAVHQFRKRAKKIRGLLRLARPALGDTYTQENRWFRDAARTLSRVRDADARLEALCCLRARFLNGGSNSVFDHFRKQLEQHRNRIVSDWLDLSETIDELSVQLGLARCRIDDWRIHDDGFSVIRGGLMRTYRRGCEAFQKMWTHPSDTRRHAWRKRTKYHWYHMRLLTGVWKPVIRSRADELERLADLLGQDHDLAVLRNTVTDDSFPCDPAMIEQLLELIRCRQRQLRRGSNDLGRRIFAEGPKQFVKRIGAYWSIWRST